MVGWALLTDVIPLYPLYALLFSDTGLSGAEISALFAIWSTVSILAEVPSGVLADRLSRRGALSAAGVLQALGYLWWITLPGFPGFAVGFLLWGLGGALISGAQEALLYDGLVAAAAQEHYAQVQGWVTAVGLVAQLPAAAAATVLFALGGYPLAGWVSIGVCLAAAVLASRLPEPSRARAAPSDGTGPGYRATLKARVVQAATRPAVRTAVLAVAVLGALDALEEYFPLLARDWGVPISLVPFVVLGITLGGAAGAALGGAASRWRSWSLALLFGIAVLALGAAGLAHQPIALIGVVVFYGLYRMVWVVADARLQERIDGSFRATVTSVAGMAIDVACLVLYVVWAAGGVVLVAAVWLMAAAALPCWLGTRVRAHRSPDRVRCRRPLSFSTGPNG
ncbi:MAG: MFS transporter [Actinomycetota bacterium]|nr:MFS transporter [Actinomycetota bacterium]